MFDAFKFRMYRKMLKGVRINDEDVKMFQKIAKSSPFNNISRELLDETVHIKNIGRDD